MAENTENLQTKAGERVDLAVLPLQQTTLFPETIIPLTVGRARSVAAVESALKTEEKLIACLTIKTEGVTGQEATPSDLYEVGTFVSVKRMMRNDDVLQLIVQGIERVKVVYWNHEQPFLSAKFEVLPALTIENNDEVEALKRNVQGMIQQALALLPQVPPEVRMAVMNAQDPVQIAYFLGSVMTLGIEQEQKMLEADTIDELLRLAHANLARELEIMQIRSKIANEAQGEMDKAQRDYILRQQLKQIQKELGDDDENGEKAETQQLRERLDQADLPEDIRKEVERELRRMEKLPQAAPDYQVIRNYLDYVLELPWKKESEDKLDLVEARKILDEDHYGLEDVKERILEFLAVIKLRPDTKSPILCLVGPPGVGKTSLGKSIARALGREFERVSLGGMRDEAELRGHRRTYIGAMPGRLIQAMRRAKVKNPVIMLDEIDKMGNDFRGDPASALLEILDPAQNSTFRDNFLDLPFDLSKTFFIATANDLAPISAPLRDRMEIIQLAGYSDVEKLNIAKQYLVPRQIKENGLNETQVSITDAAISLMTARYSREAGVRQLERTIGNVIRKLALKIATNELERQTIDVAEVREYLGAPRFYPEEARADLPAGVATGMAWTQMGGEVLFIEATLLPGSSGLKLTGQLGQVMQESAQAAQSYLWAHAAEFGINPDVIKQNGVHIHVPAGGIPKDGPSAGVTMTSALASLYTGRKVRNDTSMTGEVTLSGLVFPVGGVKEKVLAAHRAGIRHIILPERNEADIEDIPADVRKELKFTFAKRVSDVLNAALEPNATQPPPFVPNLDALNPNVGRAMNEPLIAKES